MPRLSPYTIGLLTVFTGAILLTFSNANVTPQGKQTLQISASSTPEVPVRSTKIATTTPIIATTTLKAPTKSPTPVVSKKSPATSSKLATLQTEAPDGIPLDTVSSSLRAALVNILCYASSTSNLHSISGSGVIIDPKGIILTNAHIAQYFLLANQGVSCVIRSGSPAVANYKADLIYISPAWIHANTKVLSQAEPTGTGEYDFGLLTITKSAKASQLPSQFPFVSLAQSPVTFYEHVVVASYGAQFLDFNQIQSALSPTIVFGSIKNVFTFSKDSVDVLALGGSAAAQEGSSGGGVVDSSGMLIGTITTSTVVGATDTRSLTAITASYIRSEYSREMGTTLDSLLDEPIASSVANFAPQVPILESILTENF